MLVTIWYQIKKIEVLKRLASLSYYFLLVMSTLPQLDNRNGGMGLTFVLHS